MYDVSSPASLTSLRKWWNEFRERAPVREDEEESFCVAVVGNKIDFPVASGSGHGGASNAKPKKNGDALENGTVDGNRMDMKEKWKVSESDAEAFLEELIPNSSVVPISNTNDIAEENGADADPPLLSLRIPSQPPSDTEDDQPLPLSLTEPDRSSPLRTRSKSITITNETHPRTPSPLHSRLSRSRGQSRSRSRQGYSTRGTLSTMTARESIYHTPSSSFFDVFESARSSPIPFPGGGDGQKDGYGSMRRPRVRSSVSTLSNSTTTGSLSSVSGQTITQSLFRRSGPPVSPPAPEPETPIPPRYRRPKLFFTSAKTGEGVQDVFEYVARRVVVGWEWDAREQEDWVDVWDEEETIRLGLERDGWRGRSHEEGKAMKIGRSCCA